MDKQPSMVCKFIPNIEVFYDLSSFQFITFMPLPIILTAANLVVTAMQMYGPKGPSLTGLNRCLHKRKVIKKIYFDVYAIEPDRDPKQTRQYSCLQRVVSCYEKFCDTNGG